MAGNKYWKLFGRCGRDHFLCITNGLPISVLFFDQLILLTERRTHAGGYTHAGVDNEILLLLYI